jgi:CheY-like chemotaxis protein
MAPREHAFAPEGCQDLTGALEADPHAHRPPRILLVDDDFAIAEVLGDLLRDGGYEVAHAADGEEGLSAMSARRPDLVLLDFMMPRCDGLRLLRRMQQVPRLAAVPVIIMTAAPAALPAAAVAGVPILAKPLDVDSLLSLVAESAPLRRVRAVC